MRLFFIPIVLGFSISANVQAQEQFLGTRTAGLPVYTFLEGGAAYTPNIPIKNSTFSNSGINLSTSGINLGTDIGYNFTGGLGYSFNRNLSLELEAGYINTGINNITGELSVSASGITVSDSINWRLTGASITQVPITINFVVMNPDIFWRPMAGIGLGVAPTTINYGQASGDFLGVPISGDLGSATSVPFLLKLKAGVGYAVNPHLDLGLRVFADIIGPSYLGDLQTDVYTVIGLNANLSIRF